MQPNILCLVSEDCPPRLGAYGDLQARTPNIDGLAARGVTFDTATCTSPVCAPSRFSILTGRHPESVPPAQHMTAWGEMPKDIITYPEMMRGAGYYCTNNSKTHYNVDLADPTGLWDDCSGTAHWANRADGIPFLAVFNCMLTHESGVFESQEGNVGPADVMLPAHLPDLPELRQDLASYYNRIEDMDSWMGERLAELDAAGLTEDTIVIYYSDHGSALARSKRFCYDDGLRVPLIVALPERWRHLLPEAQGSHIGTPVSLVDLLQTLAAIAKAEPPVSVQGVPFLGPDRLTRRYTASGRDRMDARYDLTRTLRSEQFRYIRNYAPHRPWGQYYSYAWLAAGYRAYEKAHLAGSLTPLQNRFWQLKPAEELYDMAADPDSVSNLTNDPAHADTLAEMRAALDAHMMEIHDCSLIPEGSVAQSEINRNDPVIYPLTRVLDVANAAIQCDLANLSTFLAVQSETSPVLRYWGAQGLLFLAVAGHDVATKIKNLIKAETDPDTLIVLHEAAGQNTDTKAAVRALTGLADSDQSVWIRLKAITALTALPLFPEISRDVIAKAVDEPSEYIRGAAGYLLHKLDGTYTPDSPIFDRDLFLKHMEGHSGIGPQSFPTIDSIKAQEIV